MMASFFFVSAPSASAFLPTPSSGGDPICTNDPNTYACLPPEFCEENPDHIRCVDIYWCESHPDDPLCITPEFCEAMPDHEKCVHGAPEDCIKGSGETVSCEPDADPSNDPDICWDAFGAVVQCPDDLMDFCRENPDSAECKELEFCPDGSIKDVLGRCPEPAHNKFPEDSDRECYDKVPGTGEVVEVPCGNSDDEICGHPDHVNDPDCCEKWDSTGQRCLDPNDDGDSEDDGLCMKDVPGTSFSSLAFCPGQEQPKDECVAGIGGATLSVPCDDEEVAYEKCVQKYDQKMCDGDPYNDFTDLPDDYEQKAAIIKLGEYCPDYLKIFQGYRDTEGNLLHVGGWADPIIRYDVVLVVQRFEECKDLAEFTGKFPFTDVPTDHYAYDAVGESFAEGKTEGYTENGVKLFKGANQVLTTEALKWIMLVRTTEEAVDAVVDKGMLDPDVFAQVQWAIKWWLAAIEWNVDKAQIAGSYYDVDPIRPATRADIAVWLANTLGL